MVTITSVEAEDRTEWLALWNGYLSFYETALDAETTDHTFSLLLDRNSSVHGALARNDDGDAVGLVHWVTHPATWTTADYCYLEDLFVSTGARGAGTGRALIAHVREWAERNGSSKVYWLTADSNATARALYDRVATRSGMIQYQVELDA